MSSRKRGFDNMGCEAEGLCWRHAYSKYLLEVGYDVPPTREQVFFSGYATPQMMVRTDGRPGGIFAETIPARGDSGSMCPDMRGAKESCPEFKKYQKKYCSSHKYSNARPRVHIPQEIRRRVAARAGYKCQYCGMAHNKILDGVKIKCVVDHFIPLALGGTSEEKNLVFACRDCNSEKRTQIWELGCKKK